MIFSAYDFQGNDGLYNIKYCPQCGNKFIISDHGGKKRPYCPNCGFVYYKNPAPGVSVLIVKNNQVLLGKRNETSFAGGKWCLPCGFIEFDEDLLTAAHREVKEETGLDIKIQSIINVTFNYLASNLHSLVVVMLAHIFEGDLCPGDDIEQLAWFPLAGPFPEMAFAADEDIINRYFEQKISEILVI